MMRAIVFAGLLTATSLSLPADTDATEAAWKALDMASQSGNLDHRRQALAAIATIPNTNDRAVKAAEDALHDKDAQVRVAAAGALGEMKAMQAAPALKAALDDTGEVAFAAAKALVDMGDPAGREMLVAVIAGERKDSPGMLTNAVREARKKIHHPEGLLLMGAADASGAMFGPAPSIGIVATKDAFKLRGVSGRATAAAALAKDPEPYAVQLLEWALTDYSWEVRASAAKALGERGNADSLSKLQVALADPHHAVRTLAAASIIRIEERQGASAAASSSR